MTGSIARSVLRRIEWIKRRIVPPVAQLIYDPEYAHSPSGVPIDAFRGERILAFLAKERLLGRDEVLRPKPVSYRQLLAVHTESYLDSLSDPQVLSRILGIPVDVRAQARLIDLHRLMVGGTVLAVRRAAFSDRVGIHLGGGFHHAFADRGHGFCVFNDLAVAVYALRAEGYKEPILIVDLDLHDGDGTRSILAKDPAVHSFSIHNQPLDEVDAANATSIALGDRVSDPTFSKALLERLPPVLDRIRPGLVIYVAGTDPAEDDRLGNWSLTAEGIFARDRQVVELVRSAGSSMRLAIVLGGGYGPNAWSYSARFLAFLLSGRRIEPPPGEELTRQRYRYLSRLISPAELSGASSQGDLLTAEDLAADLGYSAGTRFLGFYTKHGLELAFERYGFFDQLRAMGFLEPTLDLTLDPQAHLLRIFGDIEKRELLVELRLRRDRGARPPLELLSIDWLMLQNPRLAFGEHRPRWPGQDHPGLGVLTEVMALLEIACVRLGLDGLVFVPAHFHVAAGSTAHLSFLSPEDAARFLALSAALEDLELIEASWVIENGGISDVSGQPLVWPRMPMIRAISERAKAVYPPADYESQKAAALAHLEYRRAPHT